jgi:hypothetical protein
MVQKKAEQHKISFNKKQWYMGIGATMILVFVVNALLINFLSVQKKSEVPSVQKPKESHWFLLHRKSQKEYFYLGVPGNKDKSRLLKTFSVKSGIPGERPTPLPKLLGRDYWVITDEFETSDNPETAPFFLTLNIPAPTGEPYGPVPYKECSGEQCSWVLPGAFGLHGTASDSSRLSPENPGSSGCIRHRDEDITYLYNVLDPKQEEIRYYIEDI